MTLFQLAVTVGILLAYLVGAAFSASHDWRAMIIVGVTPAVVLAIGMRRMPQSPRWLVMIGEGSEAAATLRYLNPGESEEEIEQDLNEIRAGLSTETGGYGELFTPLVRMALFVGVMLAILQQITGINTVIYYAPTILQNAGFSSDTTAILAGGGVAVVNVLATIWALRLVQGYGRRTPADGRGGRHGGGALRPRRRVQARRPAAAQSVLAIVSLMVFVLSFAISLGPIFWILNSELYPMRVRSKAAGIGTMFNWAFNFIVSLTFLLLIEDLGTSNTFWLYGAISLSDHPVRGQVRAGDQGPVTGGDRERLAQARRLEPLDLTRKTPAAPGP